MKEAMINMSRWNEASEPEPARYAPALRVGASRWAVLIAALAMTAGLAAAVNSTVAAASAAGGHRPSATAATSGGTSCPSTDTAMVFTNDSGMPNTKVFGAVTLTAGTVSPTPAKYLNKSVPFSTYPAVSGETNTFYFCMVPGDTAGRLWISLGTSIPATTLPTVQPADTAPYRFGYVEFTYTATKTGTVDYSNVNDFDFPIDLQTYATSGAQTPAESSTFTGNTCQIVNATKTAVQKLGASADWTSIEKTTNGQFVRIIAPDNGYATDGGWPSMVPYIENLARSLPLHGTTYGPITVEDHYATTAGHDHQNNGWFYYQGYFNKTTFALTLNGTLHAKTAPTATAGTSTSAAGSTITVTLTGATGLAKGIYDQGHEYKVGGVQDLANDVYARIWNDLTGAFNYGYWGSQYGSGADTKDFFKTFPTPSTSAPTGGQAAFLPDRTVPFVTAAPALSYNLYAAVLSQFSPNYAFPENENYGAGGKGISPLMSIPAGGEVKATLPPDGWTGPSGSSTCQAAVTPTGPTTGTTTGPSTGAANGYYEVASDGGLFAFGTAPFYGSMGGKPLNKPVVGMASTPGGGGYWEVASDGGLFAFGDAAFYGSMGGKPLNKPIVGMASTPDGQGYWEVASDGGLFAFGDAQFYGSMGGKPLNQPIVGLASTPGGGGYWEVASDGGLFAFGDAAFYGSMGGQPLNKPIVGLATAPDGKGYWEVASDGGLFAFGTAPFYGSMGGQPLNQPVVGMASTPGGGGYWEVASDGGLFAFGDAAFYGSMGGQPLNKPIVGMTTTGTPVPN
jgi:hypothetical protein